MTENKIITFDKCPNCGSKELLTDDIKGPGPKAISNQMQPAVNINDPSLLLASNKIPILTTLLNGCGKCGTAYFTRKEITEQPMTFKKLTPEEAKTMAKTGQFPPR